MDRLQETAGGPPIRRLKAVLFDLDGTLIDSDAQMLAALQAALRDCGYNLTTSEIGDIAGVPLHGYFARRLGVGPEEAERIYQAYRRIYLEVCVPETRPLPGANALLAALSARGIALALVTTKMQIVARAVVAALGWSEVFAAIVGQDSAARPKPAPDPAQYALALLGVLPEDAAFVGDTDNDILCGLAAGVAVVIGLAGTRTAEKLREAGAAYVCQDLAAVRALLTNVLPPPISREERVSP